MNSGSSLIWTEPTPPDASSFYDHVTARTSRGQYAIDWKGWKENDKYDLYFTCATEKGEDHLGSFCTLKEAQAAGLVHFQQRDHAKETKSVNQIVVRSQPPSLEMLRHPQLTMKIVLKHPNAKIPLYATSLSSGFDLAACFDFDAETKTVAPGETILINTGLTVQIPPGYELQIRSRSGLALKNGIIVLNSPGTVDADYRAVIGVILRNTSRFDSFEITHGMRIAQGVICPVYQAQFMEIKEEQLGKTERGQGGFGSTGV